MDRTSTGVSEVRGSREDVRVVRLERQLQEKEELLALREAQLLNKEQQIQFKDQQLANAHALITQLEQDLLQAHNAIMNEAIGQQPPGDEPVAQENPMEAESEEEEEDPEEIMDVDSVIDFTEIPRLEDAVSETGSSASQEVISKLREEY